jgi:7-cyano-7-deazaguanine synthase in queuosine biosynthesis
MDARAPTWVLCGGASRKEAPADALRLQLGRGDGHEIGVDIEGLEDVLTGTLPERLRDLICIAAFILGADCATSRGTSLSVDDGRSWRRDFRFVIPVQEPEFWNDPEVVALLQDHIGFLSDDVYTFEFVKGAGWEGRQVGFLPTSGRTFVPWKHIDTVMLFSGGMDSFAGAVQECVAQGRNVLLVSHQHDRVKGVQKRLVDDLRRKAKGGGPWHVGIEFSKGINSRWPEHSQRSRSFLFASIAAAVAHLCQQKGIKFYENGIIALNLPVTEQLVGARSTRTVHPRVVEGFQLILSCVMGDTFTVVNPFIEKTRADVARIIRDEGASDLLRYTWSCARVRHAKKNEPFCGVCSQCVDRQFSVRIAGLLEHEPESLYETRLFDDELKTDAGIQQALGYVSAASVFASLATPTELASRYGAVSDALPPLARLWECTLDEARARLLALHRRQGVEVMEALGEEIKTRTTRPARAPKPGSLLGRYLGEVLQDGKRVAGADDQPEPSDDRPAVPPSPSPSRDAVGDLLPGTKLPADTFYQAGEGWVVGLAQRRGVIVKDVEGLALIRTLLRHPGRDFDALELEAVSEGREYVRTTGLGESITPERLKATKARIQELRADEEEALKNGDDAEALKCRAERESIEDSLKPQTSLFGKARVVRPEEDKARSRVAKRIDRAIVAMKGDQRAQRDWPERVELARHLSNAIDKGYSLVYRPSETRSWVTDG